MFTGIISHVGKVARNSDANLAITAKADFLKVLKTGASIAVQGACLTVARKRRNVFEADVMPETRARTNLRHLKRGDPVNLELPATPDSFLSGHLVQGHIDGVAKLMRIARKGNSRILEFSVPPPLAKYIVGKGSVAVNGISLTVAEAGKNRFTVGIIPRTWEGTTLRSMRAGDAANIEVDIIAKYVERLLNRRT